MIVREYKNTKKQLIIRIPDIDNSTFLTDMLNMWDAMWIDSLYRESLENMFAQYSSKIGQQVFDPRTKSIDIPYKLITKISPDIINHETVVDTEETDTDLILILKS